MSKFPLAVVAAAVASFMAAGGHSLIPGVGAPEMPPAGRCDIKGNISINTGERIYHLPGQLDYEQTKIRPRYGERWFCSEGEARAAGWRRAGR